jgi:hypothetical protein
MANAPKSKNPEGDSTEVAASEVSEVSTGNESTKVEGEAESPKAEAPENKTVEPKNPNLVKKAVALGKEMMRQEEVTKADVARKMYELIHEEPREIIVKALIEGANLTPKGAQTYFYNCKRKQRKGS